MISYEDEGNLGNLRIREQSVDPWKRSSFGQAEAPLLAPPSRWSQGEVVGVLPRPGTPLILWHECEVGPMVGAMQPANGGGGCQVKPSGRGASKWLSKSVHNGILNKRVRVTRE